MPLARACARRPASTSGLRFRVTVIASSYVYYMSALAVVQDPGSVHGEGGPAYSTALRLMLSTILADIPVLPQSTIGNRKSAISGSSQPFFGEFESAEDGSCLVLTLLVFAGGDGVGHDSGSGLQVGGFIFD